MITASARFGPGFGKCQAKYQATPVAMAAITS